MTRLTPITDRPERCTRSDRSASAWPVTSPYAGPVAMRRVQVLSVPVTDQDRAKAFYVDALGFDLLEDTPMGPDMRWVQVRPKGGDTSLTLVTWFETMPAGSLKGLVLETDDLDADVAALQGRGITLDGPVREQPWGRFVTFSDPDGNGIVLQATSSAAG